MSCNYFTWICSLESSGKIYLENKINIFLNWNMHYVATRSTPPSPGDLKEEKRPNAHAYNAILSVMRL